MKKNLLNFKSVAFLTLLCLLSQSNAWADCSLGNSIRTGTLNTLVTNSTYVAQPFTACESSPITSITFQIEGDDYKAENAEVRIITNTGGSGTLGSSSGTLLGTVNIIPTSSGSTVINFIPSNPLELISGQSYTLLIIMDVVSTSTLQGSSGQSRNSSGLDFSINNASTDSNLGNASTSCFRCVSLKNDSATGRSMMQNALVFQLNQGGNSVPVPTLSQWSLLIFGLLILNLGLFFVHRRELV